VNFEALFSCGVRESSEWDRDRDVHKFISNAHKGDLLNRRLKPTSVNRRGLASILSR